MHEIFKSNPTLKKAYITSDGTPFYQENDAKNHAKSLEDKSVEPVYNELELQVVDAEEMTESEKEIAAFEAEEKAKEAKAELDQALAEFDPAVTGRTEVLRLIKALGLAPENLKNETIYPLLVEAKAKVQEGTNTQE